MNAKITVTLFALAALIQLSHSKSTQRFTRENRGVILDGIVGLIGDFLDSEESDVESEVGDLTGSISSTVSELGDSEVNPSAGTKEGSSPTSSFQSHIPNFGSYPSQFPSQFNPSQYGQYTNQLPSQLNPNTYRPTSGSTVTPSAAQGSSNATP